MAALILPLSMRRTAWRLGLLTALVGASIVLGWVFDVPILRSFFPHQVEAKVNGGLCLAALGLGLMLKSGVRSEQWRGARAGAAALGGFVMILGVVTIAEYVAGRGFGIDNAIFEESPHAVATVHPGRMALPAAINFTLLGLALILMDVRRPRAVVAWLTLPTAGVSAVVFFGQLYALPKLAAMGSFTPVPAPVGMTLLLLGLGMLFAGCGGALARSERTLRNVGFAIALALLLVMGGAVWRSSRALYANSQMVVHTYDVMDRLSQLAFAVGEVESGTRGYLLTGDRAYLAPFGPAAARARELQDELRRLTADNVAQQRRLDELDRVVWLKLEFSENQLKLHDEGRTTEAMAAMDRQEGLRLMVQIRAVVAALREEELGLLADRQARVESSTSLTLLTLGLGLVVSVGLITIVFVLFKREIIARRNSEQALRRSEESLEVTLNSIGDAVMATDVNGRIRLLNPVAERLTGWTQAEAWGRPIEEVFRIINEATRQPATIPVNDVLRTGAIHGLANHTALIARDGTERAIEDSAAPIRDAQQHLLGVVLVFRDVTEARRAQAELDRFFLLSVDFLCISSADGYFKRISPGVTEMLGWTAEEFLARPYTDFIHPDDIARTRDKVKEQMQTGRRVMEFENRYRHKDGSWRTLSWRSVPVPETELMYATARDVTEMRAAVDRINRLNDAQRQYLDQLRVANKELESFSYSVSHDLRAPLRHVQGYVEMLTRESEGVLSDKAKRFLRTIADAAKEMGTLIDDLLAFSRMGRAELRDEIVDLDRLVGEVRRGLEMTIRDRAIEWKVEPLPPVRGDSAMLRQVLVNLIGNAVKYTRGRNPAVIEIGCSGREEGRLIFHVRDNGAGFDMKYADKLFGVFQRLHRADEFEGTGIGLASVRRIVSRLGGRTWAEGWPNAGAVFYFSLKPASEAANSSTPRP